MKRLLSLPLTALFAALLAASTFTSCGTSPEETDPPETPSIETEAAETAPTAEIDPNVITENGIAAAHIVVAEDGDALLGYGAEELAYHIKKVSGADVPVVHTAAENSLPIIIATPETYPDLATLFPEDIAWLSTLEDGEKRYGSDGFAIRRHENTLYIFGMTPKGALNGVYDFIEENMGVLWIRADEEKGLIYDPMPTITVEKADYREKSPYRMRGTASSPVNTATAVLYARNKVNTAGAGDSSVGIDVYHLRGVKSWILASPTYDPNITEYWNTYEDGTPIPVEEWSQVNFWSDLTADCVAESILKYLRESGADNAGVIIEDNPVCSQYPEGILPYEYAPGEFVNPGDSDYLSTVFFSFLNKVVEKVTAEFPSVTINTQAYQFTEVPPRCEISDNVSIQWCPISADCTAPVTITTDNPYNGYMTEYMTGWLERTGNLAFYHYYIISLALPKYERPIWHDMQIDMQFAAEHGFAAMLPDSIPDIEEQWGQWDTAGTWDVAAMTFWINYKLEWNPYEDVDELIRYYCDKVYGAASPHMQEYYRLLRLGWEEATDAINYIWAYDRRAEFYFEIFVFQTDTEAAILDALHTAYEAAESEAVKARIRPVMEAYETAFPEA